MPAVTHIALSVASLLLTAIVTYTIMSGGGGGLLLVLLPPGSFVIAVPLLFVDRICAIMVALLSVPTCVSVVSAHHNASIDNASDMILVIIAVCLLLSPGLLTGVLCRRKTIAK